MKLVLEVINGVVADAKEIEDSKVSNVTNSTPYTKDDDKANPYAKLLRLRDQRNSDGWDCQVIVLDSGDPEDYILKTYNKSTQQFSNDSGETEERRLYRLNMKNCLHSVDKNRYVSDMVPNDAELAELASAYGDHFEGLKNKIISRQELTYDEKLRIESKLNTLDYTTMEKWLFQVANMYTVLSYKKRDGQDVAGEYLQELSYWWSKFVGTRFEVRALSEIAACHVRAKDGDAAVRIYKEILEDEDITDEIRAEVTDRINFIGVGNSIADAAERDLADGNYAAAEERVRQFEAQAKGMMKKYNESKINNVKTIVECQKLKEAGDSEGVENKKQNLNKQFYGIMAEPGE